MRACFDADGRLRPDAASSRPNPADAAHIPPRIPATDDPEEIIAEAFVHACQHGRTEVVRWFLDHGVRPDVAPYLGRTGLHWAIPYCHLEVIRLLPERGADPSIRDEFLQADADGWRLWRKSRDDYASYASEEPLVTAGDGVVRGLCAPTPVLRGVVCPSPHYPAGIAAVTIQKYEPEPGWLHIFFATRWHDPEIQQIHDLIESRSRQA